MNARVIAATNRDLAAEVKAGKFREDLFYRLNVFPIRVPPLRERGDDVPLLAAAFARRCAQKIGRQTAPLSSDDSLRLKAYPWPGNVRELQNVIERAVITAQEGRLNLERALPEVDRGAIAETSPPENVPGQVRTQRELEELERRNILLALEQVSWRISGENGAARLLGMNPSTLSSRMKALDIKRPGAVATSKP